MQKKRIYITGGLQRNEIDVSFVLHLFCVFLKGRLTYDIIRMYQTEEQRNNL